MSALCWIRNDRPWKQYVARRVSEIRRLTTQQNWRHCPGPLNPADFPSRGLTGQKLWQATTWWDGPAFLQLPSDAWPDENITADHEDDVVCKELARHPSQPTHVLIVPSSTASQLEKVIDCSRFGNLNRLVRVTAYVYRFVNALRKAVSSCHTRRDLQLHPDELHEAETLWVRHVQFQMFPKELQYLEKKSWQDDQVGLVAPVYVKQFQIYLDDDRLMKCRGRINNAAITTTQENPILLPAKHYFVDLLIKNRHEKVKHNGVNDTLIALREKYWIVRGRQAVKRVVRSCVSLKVRLIYHPLARICQLVVYQLIRHSPMLGWTLLVHCMSRVRDPLERQWKTTLQTPRFIFVSLLVPALEHYTLSLPKGLMQRHFF